MAIPKKILTISIIIALIATLKSLNTKYGYEKDEIMQIFKDLSDRLGFWAIPIYVLIHTVTLALCLPYAIFFEAGASLLFGFFPAVMCVFCAKVLGASLSFGIGRIGTLLVHNFRPLSRDKKEVNEDVEALKLKFAMNIKGEDENNTNQVKNESTEYKLLKTDVQGPSLQTTMNEGMRSTKFLSTPKKAVDQIRSKQREDGGDFGKMPQIFDSVVMLS